jgi:hypothetical protein
MLVAQDVQDLLRKQDRVVWQQLTADGQVMEPGAHAQ